LQAATRGLWGRKRLEVREELTAHILERAYRHEVAGLGHEVAVARAIAELGSPQTIRAGMIGVYTMPNLLKISGAMTVLVAGAIAFWGVSRAQVTGINRLPIAECADTQTSSFEVKLNETLVKASCNTGFWLSIESLRSTLEPLGVKIRPLQGLNSSRNFTPWLVEFPQGGTAYIRQQQSMLVMGGAKYPYIAGYIQASDFIDSLRLLNAPLMMSGWNNPIIRVGGIKFSIGSSQNPVRGEDWYRNGFSHVLQSWIQGWLKQSVLIDTTGFIEANAQNSSYPQIHRKYTHPIKSELPVGQIVVVLERNAPRVITINNQDNHIPTMFRAYITTVGQGGIITFPSDSKTIRFMEEVTDLRAGKPDEAIDLAVLKFTSQLNRTQQMFSVVSPSKLSK
jgi:hypothetical protein